MLNEILHKCACGSDGLDDSEIAELRRSCREHPADALAPALLLKYAGAELDAAEIAFCRARVALYAGEPSVLIKAIDPSGKGFDSFYPPVPEDNRPSTVNAIDIFLETYGHQSAEEDALLERMIFNPVPDYAEQLARQNAAESPKAPAGSQDELIDAFLAQHPAETPDEPTDGLRNPDDAPGGNAEIAESKPANIKKPGKKATPSSAASPSLLSQSLAKIFIKQGRYERAHEIILNLSLNYPEKSVYFADQLRFLEKLIANQQAAEA